MISFFSILNDHSFSPLMTPNPMLLFNRLKNICSTKALSKDVYGRHPGWHFVLYGLCAQRYQKSVWIFQSDILWQNFLRERFVFCFKHHLVVFPEVQLVMNMHQTITWIKDEQTYSQICVSQGFNGWCSVKDFSQHLEGNIFRIQHSLNMYGDGILYMTDPWYSK